MKREEAIAILQDKHDECKAFYDLAAHPEDAYPGTKEYMEALQMALAALRGPTQEQVEKAWRGEWKHYLPPLGAGDVQCRCTNCGRTPDVETPFCAWCGRAMTDEAVDIVMERLEVLKDGSTD